MKAMILAAGFGTRLGAITQQTPKCLVRAGGKTLLEYVIERLTRAGVTELVINLHHLGAQIEEFVRSKNCFGLTVHFSREPEILGTGGGVKFAEALLEHDKPFFIHNADIYSELDLAELYRAHAASGAIASLAVMERVGSRALLFTKEGSLCGWESGENTTGLPRACVEGYNIRLAFSGIQVVSPRLFPYMASQQGKFSIISSYLAAVQKGERVAAFRMDGRYWLDVGTPERLSDLEIYLHRK